MQLHSAYVADLFLVFKLRMAL